MGGSGFNHFIVMHFRAAVNTILNRYALDLSSRPSGKTVLSLYMMAGIQGDRGARTGGHRGRKGDV